MVRMWGDMLLVPKSDSRLSVMIRQLKHMLGKEMGLRSSPVTSEVMVLVSVPLGVMRPLALSENSFLALVQVMVVGQVAMARLRVYCFLRNLAPRCKIQFGRNRKCLPRKDS